MEVDVKKKKNEKEPEKNCVFLKDNILIYQKKKMIKRISTF